MSDELSAVDRDWLDRVNAHLKKVDDAADLGRRRRQEMRAVQIAAHDDTWRLTWWDQEDQAHEHAGISSFQNALRQLEEYFFPDYHLFDDGPEVRS